MSDQDYRLLARIIYARSGIQLGETKKELLRARLLKRLSMSNCTLCKFTITSKTSSTR